MELDIDLKRDPRLIAASQRAGELKKGADDDWASIQARVLGRVARWEYATGVWRGPPGNPIWPELLQTARGRLVDDEARASYSYGYDDRSRLVVWREREEVGWSVHYFEYGESGWTEWQFSELPEKNFKRAKAVGVGWFVSGPEDTVSVNKAELGEGRTRASRNDHEIEVWEAYSRQPGMPKEREDFDQPRHSTARLDRQGRPIVVWQDGEVIFKQAKGNFDKQLERLRNALAREIPKQVAKEHGGHELYAVCLSYGEGEELLPPAVIGCRTDDFDKLVAAPGRHWDAGPLWGLREPIHLDALPSVQKALEPVSYQLIEPANEAKAEAMLVALARELNAVKWPKKVKLAPGFVVYAANAERGDFQAQLQSVLDEPTEKVLREKGWWPPNS